MVSKEKTFRFHVPVELSKAEKNEDGDWKIKGIASTPDEDLQGETVNQDGLDISMVKAGRGLFNVDHQKGPENIVGQIEDADFIKHDGKKALQVEGYLFKHQPRAQAFHNIMRSVKKSNGPRVHLSVEGKILQRDMADTKHVKKARIEKVALTLDPVNPYTYADLCKSMATDEVGGPVQEVEIAEDSVTLNKSDLESLIALMTKALAAGAGHAKAPTARTGGEAMQTESMDSDDKNVTHEKKKKNRKTMLKSLIEGLRKAHPDRDPLELAQWVIEAYAEKI